MRRARAYVFRTGGALRLNACTINGIIIVYYINMDPQNKHGLRSGSPRGANRGDRVATVVATVADAACSGRVVFIILLLCLVASPVKDLQAGGLRIRIRKNRNRCDDSNIILHTKDMSSYYDTSCARSLSRHFHNSWSLYTPVFNSMMREI